MPLPCARCQKFGRALRNDPVDLLTDGVRVIFQLSVAQCVCAIIMRERRVMIAAFFHRLTKRKMQMIFILHIKAGRFQRLIHGGDIFIREAGGFQIGEAPPNFAQGRFHRKRAPIRGNALVLMANGFEHMAIAHPQFGVVGKPRGQFLIERNRLFITTNPAKCCGLQVLLDRVIALFSQHGIEMLKRFWKAVLLV